MDFKKPTVSYDDLAFIGSQYPFGKVIACQDLGGIPNTTYKIVTDNKEFVIRISSHGQSSLEHIQLEIEVLQYLDSIGFPSLHLLAGINGQILQQWQGYWFCASDFIPGLTADKIDRTQELLANTGKLVASYQEAMASFRPSKIPQGETFIEKGRYVLNALAPALRKLEWQIGVSDRVIEQWETACRPFIKNSSEFEFGIIHADIWPPNVLCNGNEVTALVDFDDCCYGPTIIDISLAFMEFSMFNDIKMNQDLALAFLVGYLNETPLNKELNSTIIVNAMEMACAAWLAYEVVEAPTLERATVYLERLNRLYDKAYKQQMINNVQALIEAAQYRLMEARR